MQCDIWGYSVEADLTATADWYRASEGWHCDCGHCQNFLELVRQNRLPSAVTDLLESLGVPPEKPTYVCELYPTGQGNFYQFNYRLADHIESDPHPVCTVSFDWGAASCGHDPYPYGAPDFPELTLI